MKILAIDTSSKFLSIAFSDKKDLIAEETHLLERRHSGLLVVKVKAMLEKAGSSIDDVDIFVVGLGPGSFTGLRIGVSAVKGFGVATGKPCIGVSSMDAMALEADGDKALIVPVIDAKREKLYSAIYRKNKNRLIRKTTHLLLSPEELVKKIKGAAVFLGDGIPIYREKLERLSRETRFLNEDFWYPKAKRLTELALYRTDKDKGRFLGKLKPIYLYAKDCQVKKR